MENMSPNAITVPNGPHKLERLTIIGITPTAAAEDVKKIGRIRLSAARIAAFLTL